MLVAARDREAPGRGHGRRGDRDRALQPTGRKHGVRPGRAERARAPERELPQHGAEALTGGRQLVEGRGGRWQDRPPRDDAVRLEVAQALGEDVRRAAAEALEEVGVAQRTMLELADDEQRPALADEVEGIRDRAELVVGLAHTRERTTPVLETEARTCKKQVPLVVLPPHRRERGSEMADTTRKKWLALALICLVQFMIVLDIAIVNVALPSIQMDLGFSQENLQWIISAYALLFGGFLLLGGRLGDRLGRRRLFFAGLVVFTIGSLLCGLAWSEAAIIVARGIQGFGAALVSPSALAILTTTFREDRERNIALGVWGATGGFGAAAGVLFGGVLTDLLSWEWIFFVNIPVGVLALVLTPLWIPESRDARATTFDFPGAGLITGSLIVAVLGITQANQWGWGSATTWITFGVAAVLFVLFLAWESRQVAPLIPLSIFRVRTVLGANIASFILATALFSMFLMLTLYMQQVLHFSPMKTGLGYLAVAGTAILWANVAALLVNRVGAKTVIVAGMGLMTVGMLLFTQVSVGGSYVADLLPGFLVIGIGMPFTFVGVAIAAVAGVTNEEAGLASGLYNTTQQIGGALGIAILSAVATSVTSDHVSSGVEAAKAAVDGFRAAFWVGVGVTAFGVVASLVFLRRSELEAAPAGEAATVTAA